MAKVKNNTFMKFGDDSPYKGYYRESVIIGVPSIINAKCIESAKEGVLRDTSDKEVQLKLSDIPEKVLAVLQKEGSNLIKFINAGTSKNGNVYSKEFISQIPDMIPTGPFQFVDHVESDELTFNVTRKFNEMASYTTKDWVFYDTATESVYGVVRFPSKTSPHFYIKEMLDEVPNLVGASVDIIFSGEEQEDESVLPTKLQYFNSLDYVLFPAAGGKGIDLGSLRESNLKIVESYKDKSVKPKLTLKNNANINKEALKTYDIFANNLIKFKEGYTSIFGGHNEASFPEILERKQMYALLEALSSAFSSFMYNITYIADEERETAFLEAVKVLSTEFFAIKGLFPTEPTKKTTEQDVTIENSNILDIENNKEETDMEDKAQLAVANRVIDLASQGKISQQEIESFRTLESVEIVDAAIDKRDKDRQLLVDKCAELKLTPEQTTETLEFCSSVESITRYNEKHFVKSEEETETRVNIQEDVKASAISKAVENYVIPKESTRTSEKKSALDLVFVT